MSATLTNPKSSRQLLQDLRDTNQDYEWYPTTNEILHAVVKHCESLFLIRRSDSLTVLDVGCGDGKALMALRKGLGIPMTLLGIEKSERLRMAAPCDVLFIGTDFMQQTLFDKKVHLLFCNPPYSDFVRWTCKILRECSAPYMFLVIPQRWRDNADIQELVTKMKYKVQTVGSFSFENAEDRKARAEVDVLCVQPPSRNSDVSSTTMFEDMFGEYVRGWKSDAQTVSATPQLDGVRARRSMDNSTAIVSSVGYLDMLVDCYVKDMVRLHDAFRKITSIDIGVLKELDLNPDRVLELLRLKIENTKLQYWKEVFDNCEGVNKRVVSKLRNSMLNTLKSFNHCDFTRDNVDAVLMWVLKNAQANIDEQLVMVHVKMTYEANVKLYKSNRRVFQHHDWRRMRCNDDTAVSHYALEYRVVLDSCGGIYTGDYAWEGRQGLTTYGWETLEDLIIVARNLGFDASDNVWQPPGDWQSGVAREICYTPAGETTPRVLMRVKAFKNGNMHINFCPKFMLAFNVEFGRLRGWLHDGDEAASELDNEEAREMFERLSRRPGLPQLARRYSDTLLIGSAANNTTMRWAVTYKDDEGMRKLMGPCNSRSTHLLKERADEQIRMTLQNNSPEQLRQVFGKQFAATVKATLMPCYPSGDPMHSCGFED